MAQTQFKIGLRAINSTRTVKVCDIRSRFNEKGTSIIERGEAMNFLTIELRDITGREPTEEDCNRYFKMIYKDK